MNNLIQISIIFILFASQTYLHADVNQDILSCGQIDSNSERLKCYDEILHGLSSKTVKESLKGSELITSLELDNEISNSSAINDTTITEPEEQKVKIVYLEKPEVPNVIHANLKGDFKGWSPDSVFVLDNGQVWRAVRANARTRKLGKALNNPKITISKSTFGSYIFRVEGFKGKLKVKRLN